MARMALAHRPRPTVTKSMGDSANPSADGDMTMAMQGSARAPATPRNGIPPLRLALVCHCLRPEDERAGRIGGAERAAAELLAAFRARDDVEVRLLAASAASDRLKFVGFALQTLRELARLARAGKIDAVLFTGLPTAWMVLLLAPILRANGVASASICHGHDVTWDFAPYQWVVTRMLGVLDIVLPVSQATGAHCLERRVDPSRMLVVANGADLDRFAPPPDPGVRRAILRAAFADETRGLAEDEMVICSVGRQVGRKGHAWFVREVVPKLDPGVRYWLAGDGPEAPSIAAAVMQSGVGDRVRRLGAINEAQLEALYRGADVFVMPNVPIAGDIEGFGLVLVEANLNGLPVVAADLEGPAEVICEGRNGRLIRPLDAEGFARVIGELHQDPEGRHALAARADAYARANLGWAPIAARHAAALRAAHASRMAARASQGRGPVVSLETASAAWKP